MYPEDILQKSLLFPLGQSRRSLHTLVLTETHTRPQKLGLPGQLNERPPLRIHSPVLLPLEWQRQED